ncbi:MAG: M48 family metallopeptidase [Bacteroidales bacterium]|nr:M48 family metallopeptidase [Bacteroidales bacterium]
MTADLLFWILIGIIIFDFVIDQVLDYLNSTYRKKTIPELVKDVYDDEKYKKQQSYSLENYKFSIISSSFSIILVLLMFLFEGFAFVDKIAKGYSDNPIFIALIFFGILMIASDILSIPFAYYDTFVIEEKYGFNKTTGKTFILDKIKSWFLIAVLGGGILSLIIWFYRLDEANFWLFAWIGLSAIMLFMAMFYSNIIVPLFNKQSPLQEGELRTAIEEFSKKVGYKLKNIYVIDGSKRSTKANAYFTGLGGKKRIVLYDTLISELTKEQIIAVLAHEIGHYKKKHTLIGIFTSLIQTGIMLFLFSLFAGNPILSEALGISTPGFHIALIVFGLLYSPVSIVLGLFMNTVSRKNEYAADKYAAQVYNSEHLISGLKKLSSENLSNLTPHPWYVFFTYSHPTLLQRIEALQKLKV